MKKQKTDDSLSKTEFGMPAIATQLHKIKLGSGSADADLIEGQVVCLKKAAAFEAFRVDFVSSHRPDGEVYDRVDVLVLSSMIEKASETLTYWTDFERELAIPLAGGVHKMLVSDFFKPNLLFVNEAADVQILPKKIGQHCWPTIKSSQEDIVRMEATGNGESKFWSIWKTGSRVFYSHGKIGDTEGTEGSYVTTSVRQAGGASRFMQRKVAEKLRKGYVEV